MIQRVNSSTGGKWLTALRDALAASALYAVFAHFAFEEPLRQQAFDIAGVGAGIFIFSILWHRRADAQRRSRQPD